MADTRADAEHDIATVPGVRAYTAGTPFESTDIQRLSGGFANYTFRVSLREAYKGHPTVVLKHSKPMVLSSVTNTQVSFTLKRQAFEAEALKRVREIMSTDLKATTPEVFLFDKTSGVIIMEDCGPGSKTLKQLILDHEPSEETSTAATQSFLGLVREIGGALGRFAGILHSWGTKDEHRSAIDYFGTFEDARRISGWATYGRLISTLTGKDNLPVLKDPLLEVPKDKLDLLAKIAEERQKQYMAANETMIHGDFWTGNVLVNVQRRGAEFVLNKIFVVDWELARPGIKGVDLGQFCAELHLLRRFHEGTSEVVDATLKALLETYNQYHTIDIAYSRVANAHLGAHLVGWVPRVPWGEKDRVREVVAEGVDNLVQAYSGPDDWLTHSTIPPMV